MTGYNNLYKYLWLFRRNSTADKASMIQESESAIHHTPILQTPPAQPQSSPIQNEVEFPSLLSLEDKDKPQNQPQSSSNQEQSLFTEQYYEEGDLVLALSPESIAWPGRVIKVLDNYKFYQVSFIKHTATGRFTFRQMQDFSLEALKEYEKLLNKKTSNINPATKKKAMLAFQAARKIFKEQQKSEKAENLLEEGRKINHQFFADLFKQCYFDMKKDAIKQKQRHKRDVRNMNLSPPELEEIYIRAKEKALRIFYNKNASSMLKVSQSPQSELKPVETPKQPISSHSPRIRPQSKKKMTQESPLKIEKDEEKEVKTAYCVKNDESEEEQEEEGWVRADFNTEQINGSDSGEAENNRLFAMRKTHSNRRGSDAEEEKLMKEYLRDHFKTEQYLRHELKIKRKDIQKELELVKIEEGMSIAAQRLQKYYQHLSHVPEEHLVAIAERILNRMLILACQIKAEPSNPFTLSTDWGLLTGILQGNLISLKALSQGNIVGKVAYVVHGYKQFHHLYKQKNYLEIEYLGLQQWMNNWNKHYEIDSSRAGICQKDRNRTLQALRRFDSHQYK